MFLETLIFALIVGYILKGSIKNLDYTRIKGIYIAFAAFAVEVIVMLLIRKFNIKRGTLTYSLDLLMYIMLLVFTWFNRKNPWLVLMGAGFLLNGIAIFTNGGAMPVSASAAKTANMGLEIESEGLYRLVDSNTRFWYLADIVPKTFLRHFVISIGDIISAIGLFAFVVTQMRKTQPKS